MVRAVARIAFSPRLLAGPLRLPDRVSASMKAGDGAGMAGGGAGRRAGPGRCAGADAGSGYCEGSGQISAQSSFMSISTQPISGARSSARSSLPIWLSRS